MGRFSKWVGSGLSGFFKSVQTPEPDVGVDREAIRQAIVQAIMVAANEAYQTVGKASLYGFALCTHDDLDSVFHVYATRDWVREHEADYPGIGFIPVEWSQQSGDQLFLSVSELLKKWALLDPRSSPDPDAGRKERFGALVDAMKACRDEGLFDEQTLLSVESTDPDNEMVKLACEAARTLNSQELADAYCHEIAG